MPSFEMISRNLLFHFKYYMLCLLSFHTIEYCCSTSNDTNPWNYLDSYCGNITYNPNSPSGSIYRANLNFLLDTLSSHASWTDNNGFYNFSTGDDPSNKVYGLFLCRGDVNTDVCKECVADARTRLLHECPNKTAAIVWYDECLVRFSDQTIFSKADLGENLTRRNPFDVPGPDWDKFKMVLINLLHNAADKAANHTTGKKFAVEEGNYSTDQKRLYTLTQCTPDLSPYDCKRCLTEAIIDVPACCSKKQGGRVIYPSCNLRYEVSSFYDTVSSASPNSPGGPPPKSTEAESLQYSLTEIQIATNNFSMDNKIGEGGFGRVYKGVLGNGQEVAVKRLSRSSVQGAEEFKNEIVVVAKLQHRNLVRLLGFCLEGEEKILIYEFVANKSLDYFLFDPENKRSLNWSRRYNIIGGIAKGLLYLHEDSRLRIVHRDLKVSNILLDGNMSPKIADFGMAKICGVDQYEGNTNRIAGTVGYMAPEYTRWGQFSLKSDVFSFGVVILEIVTGKKSSDFHQSRDSEDLLSYAWNHWRLGQTLALLDSSIGDSYARNEVIQCIQVGLLCVEEDASKRPTMASVVCMLNPASVSLPTPHRPAVFRSNGSESRVDELKVDQSNAQRISAPSSVNDASITEPYPR
ncbi:cysteine-rich receptor-like protein kinase 25 [Coffea arabica]|uniref:Cysteine-rich receptor-like protein kinase 25 n=1 Tax=Coffea arabica TaxID=13443 RepID=A0ABM4UES9_COFAR